MTEQDRAVQRRVNALHALVWAHFIEPETQTLLTRLTLAGKPLFVPGVRESPSIEDGSLCGGMYLDALVQRYEVTRKPGAAQEARLVLGGLLANATVSAARGMLARGRHPDGLTYWGNPSVDQYTGVMFGLWRYYHSSLAEPEEQQSIRTVLLAMLQRMERHHWLLLNEDDDTTTVWDLAYLDPTRAERLLSFLLVGYDVSGDGHWLHVYAQKKTTRLERCRNYDIRDCAGRPYPAWVQLQNALSLRMLLDLAPDPTDLAVFREGARSAVASGLPQLTNYRMYVPEVGRRMSRADMVQHMLWGEGPLTAGIRNPFDAISTILLLGAEHAFRDALAAYRDMMLGIDFAQLRTAWFTYPGEYNYWLAVRRNLIAYDPLIDGETQGEAYRMLGEDVYGGETGGGSIGLR